MILLLEQLQGRNLEDAAVAAMQKRGLQLVNGQRTRINGLDAFVGTYQGQMQNGGTVGVRGAHIVHGDRVFLIVGLAPANTFSNAVQQFDGSIRTFRAISGSEAANVRPNRVDLYTVRGGDTWESIAKSRSRGAITASMVAIMNGHDPGTSPRPGERIRIVVGG